MDGYINGHRRIKGYPIPDEWDPIAPVEAFLRSTDLTETEVEDLTQRYREYRDPQPDTPLRPVEISTYDSERWSDLLSERERGVSALDQVGGDYLREIGQRLRLTETLKGRDLCDNKTLFELIVVGALPPLTITTPQGFEILSDTLAQIGVRYESDNGEGTEIRRYFNLFSTLPQRRYRIGDLGHPLEWVTDTANYNRYLRRIETCFQDGETLSGAIQRIPVEAYNLPDQVSIYGGPIVPVYPIVRAIVLCQELRLWDPEHRARIPAYRTIAEAKGAEYEEILRSALIAQEIRPQRYLTVKSPMILRILTAEISEILRTGSISQQTLYLCR